MNKPLLSICCITYNHEKFIAQTLEGFVIQQTNFEFEIVISNDCSTDATQLIIDSYKIQYPHLFKDVSPNKNLGMMPNFKQTIEACTGKYIALCEGDDYWTDPLKLQKQVDFLENNADFSICFHKTKVTDLIQKTTDFSYAGYFGNDIRSFTIYDFFKWNCAATASVVFKNNYLLPLPSEFEKFPIADYLVSLTILTRSKKNAIYLPDCMAVYTNHIGGHGKENAIAVYYKSMIDFYKKLQKNVLQGNYLKESTEQLISFNRKLYKENIQQHKYFQAIIYFLKYLIFRFKLKF